MANHDFEAPGESRSERAWRVTNILVAVAIGVVVILGWPDVVYERFLRLDWVGLIVFLVGIPVAFVGWRISQKRHQPILAVWTVFAVGFLLWAGGRALLDAEQLHFENGHVGRSGVTALV